MSRTHVTHDGPCYCFKKSLVPMKPSIVVSLVSDWTGRMLKKNKFIPEVGSTNYSVVISEAYMKYT
jgi:hypothetical protein